MTDWKQELHRTWMLQRTPSDADVVRAHVLTPDVPRPLRVHTSADGARHLLVPGASGAQAETMTGEALRCDVVTLTFDGTTARFLDISCHRPSLFDVFDDLLVSVVTDAVESGDPMAAASDVLRRWRELLRAWSASMAVEREIGLFAELHVLDLVSERTATLDPTWWRGPAREPKDVVLPDAWVEVKAVGPNTSTVWINGVEQLADLPGSDGHLAVLTVVEDEDAGRTVTDIADRLRTRATDPSAFDDRLVEAGWYDGHEGRRWRVDGIDVVDAALCPRLTGTVPSPAPAGIGRLRYQVDLVVVRSVSAREGVTTLRNLVTENR